MLPLLNPIAQCGLVAEYLWQKGWAERNGGNIVVRLDALPPMPAPIDAPASAFGPFDCGVSVPQLAGCLLYCKGSGKRMRDLAASPLDNGSIIRITPDGRHYEIVSPQPVRPTSELAAHLIIHDYLVSNRPDFTATLHTHPLSLVAMSHTPQDSASLTQTLHSMIPEARLFCPKGIALLPYAEPGSTELAQGTLRAIQQCDIVLWEKHGTFAVGTDIMDAFDTTDIMEKSADIFLRVQCLR